MSVFRFEGIGVALMLILNLFFLSVKPASAQLSHTETFDYSTQTLTLPLGWQAGKYGIGSDPDNFWDRTTVGINPTATPYGVSTGMMRYQSFIVATGEASFIASKKFAMNGTGANAMPAGGAPFNFYFWRDNNPTYASSADRIQVYVNDSAVITGGATGATLLTEQITLATAIHRSQTLSPVTGINGWVNYSYLIPNTAPYNGAAVYVMILAISADGNNMYLDNFTITSYPTAQTFSGAGAAQVVSQNTNTTSQNQSNQQIIGCKITMSGALSPKVLTNMEFNTNGSTNPVSDISLARLYFTGANNVFDITTAVLMGTYTAPWATNFSFLTAPNASYTGLASFNGLQHGDNYFWLLYDIPAGATTGNVVDAEWIGLNMSGSGTVVPSVQTLPGNRLIDVSYCVPTYIYGCWQNFYNLNDYIWSVSLTGGLLPDLNNNKNWILTSPGPNASENCGVGPWPKDCPYQTHGPDYELFQENNHPGYTIGRSTTKTLKADGTTVYTISAEMGTWYSSNYVAAFLDFNHDGDFFDAGEKITQSGSLAAHAVHSATFTVPITATPGKTRLRVREVYADSNIDPCNTRTYGETEDYVVTIGPDCPAYPGYTTWLGLTDDWNDADNWCPATVPTTTTNVRIPGGPTGAYQYVRPKIKTGVPASAQKLRIEANDTLFIDATTGSSLTVTDSLKIETATSALMVNTTSIDTVQIYNGTLSRPIDSPLSSSLRSRSFLSYQQSELLAQGLAAGDVITNILIHFQRKSNGNPYRNLNVKYFYTTASQSVFGLGVAANIPVPTGIPASPITIFSGDLDVTLYAASINDYGTINLTLSTPIVWNGGTNPLIIELCYDNTGFSSTGTNDELRFTQTTGLRRYMNMEALSSFPKAGCALSPKDTVFVNASGTAGSNTFTLTNPSAAANIYPGQLCITPPLSGLLVISVAGTTVTMSGVATANFTSVNLNFLNVITTCLVYRPNITFKTSRPYMKYPITVAGHWENNGTFEPAESRVTLNGTISNQKIDGLSTTTFYDLNIQNNNHVIRYTDFIVTDSLRLVSGRLKLNNGLVALTNPGIGALTRVSGNIQAETDLVSNNLFPFGRLRWQMGATPGLRQIPFISSAGVSIPMDYNIDSGTHDVILGTYNTNAANLNLPLPEVTNILGINNATGGGWGTDGWSLADRYYFIDNSAGVAPQADITFRYAPVEQAQSGNVNMSAQRWMNSTDIWDLPLQPNQIFTAGVPNSVILANYSDFTDNTWWVIGTASTPLGGDNYNNHTQCWYEVLTGNDYTIGLKNDSSLWGWGNGTYGQLGDGMNVARNYPMQIGVTDKWLTAAVGLLHVLAIKDDGTLWAWGDNNYGQLGDGTNFPQSVPIQIGSDTDWKSVAAGEFFSIAQKTNGTLWAWGDNSNGQLGTGNGVSYSQPTQVGTANNWRFISAGRAHVLAIKTDGTLWSWGLGLEGALGNGSNLNSLSPQQVGISSDWKIVAGGASHSSAIRTNGTLWTWGTNSQGQLGNGTLITSYTPGQVGSGVDWTRISNGWSHSLAVKTNGSLWAWGFNQYGQIGDNTTVNKTTPVQIAPSSVWQTASSGFGHSFAIKDDGTLWGWGWNVVGQLGNETNTGTYVPLKNEYFSTLFAVDTVSSCIAPVTLNAGPGYHSYLWNTGAATQTIAVNNAGWYMCTVAKTDCYTTDSIYVALAPPDTTYLSVSICPGDTYMMPDSQVVSTTGIYFANLTGSNGCDSIVSVNLTASDLIAPVVSNCPLDFSTCNPVFWTPPQFTDSCFYTVNSNYLPGSFFPPGLHTITYTATDAGNNSTSCSFDVTVLAPAIAPDSITSDRLYNNICINQNITLTLHGGNFGFQGSWEWFTGSCGGTALAAFSGMSSITVSPTVTTTYYVRAENSCNTSACAEITVIVSASPPGTLSVVSMPPMGYIGGTGVITVSNSPDATYYSWKLLSGNQNAVLFNGSIGPVTTTVSYVNVAFQLAQNRYQFRIFSGNACGRSNIIIPNVRGTVEPAACLNGPLLVCPLQTATYSVFSCPIPNATGYQWTIQPAGAATILSGQGSPVINVQFAAGYTTADICVAGLSQSSIVGPQTCVTVSPNTSVVGSISGDMDPCEGSLENYSVSPVAGATGYLWTTTITGATISGTSTTGTVQFPAGPFSGQLCVQSLAACGASVASCTTVTSVTPGVPGPITGPVSNLCGASNINYSLNTGNANSYNWILPPGITLISSGNSNSINVNYNPGTTGPQTITVQAFYDCNMASSSIIVDGTPDVPTVTPATICPGLDQFYQASSGGPGITYSWNTTGADTSFCTNPTCSQYYVDWLLSGCTLSVTASNSCGTSPVYSVPNSCRLRSDNLPDIKIYPNPTDGEFTIEFNGSLDNDQRIIITDMTGRVILKKVLPSSSGRVSQFIQLNVNPGIYNLFFIDTDGTIRVRRITVIR